MSQPRNPLLQLADDALAGRDDLPDELGRDIAVAAIAAWAELNPGAIANAGSLLDVVELFECTR